MGVNNPRNVRHAIKQGWTVYDVPNSVFDTKQISYLGLVLWAQSNMSDCFVSSFQPTCRFAFRLESDASWFNLKWL